jgi:hypothetical protein
LWKRIWCFNQPMWRISPPFRKEKSFIDGDKIILTNNQQQISVSSSMMGDHLHMQDPEKGCGAPL